MSNSPKNNGIDGPVSFGLNTNEPKKFGLVIPRKSDKQDLDLKSAGNLFEETTKREKTDIIPCKPDAWKVRRANERKNEKYSSLDEREKSEYKRQLEHCADDVDDYERVHIPDYGKALLRGMGWEEGKPYGRANKIIEPIVLPPRPKLAGIGATSQQKQEKKRKRVDRSNSLETYLLKTRPKNIEENVIVGVVSGHREGDIGRVIKILDKEKLLIRLPNQLEIKVYKEDCKLLDISSFKENHPVRQFAQEESMKDEVEEMQKKKEEPPSKKRRITWVVPLLRVRIISKSIGGGRFYTKKGVVEDVPNPFECTIRMDNGTLLDGVAEHNLETVIPKMKNEKVMCVLGKYKGKKGRLIERDKRREKCIVQLTGEEGQLITVNFDDVCEYVGQISDD